MGGEEIMPNKAVVDVGIVGPSYWVDWAFDVAIGPLDWDFVAGPDFELDPCPRRRYFVVPCLREILWKNVGLKRGVSKVYL